jgi:hypothetical protein
VHTVTANGVRTSGFPYSASFTPKSKSIRFGFTSQGTTEIMKNVSGHKKEKDVKL